MKKYKDVIEPWVKASKSPKAFFIFVLPFVFLFLNLHMTTSFSMAIDNELALGRENPNIWLLEGRWGSTVVESIFGTGVAPWTTYLIFAILFSAAFVLWVLAVSSSLDWRLLPAFAIASTLPTFWLLLIFRANLIPAGFAYLFVALALVLLINFFPRQPNLLIRILLLAASIALLAFAISIYQAFFTVYLLGLFAVGIFGKLESKKLLSVWIRSLLVLLASLAIFQLVNLTLQRALNFESGGYITSYWQPQVIWENPTQHLGKLAMFIAENIFTLSSALGRTAWLVPILVITVVTRILFSKSITPKLLKLVSIVGFFTTPFTVAIFAAGPENTPLRSLVALPMVFAVLTYLLLDSDSQVVKALGVTLAIGIVLQFTSITAEYAAVDRLRDDFDAQLASQIYSKLESGCSPDDAKISAAFLGGRSFVTNLATARGSTFGASIFSWSNLSDYPWRVNELMRARGYGNFSAVRLADLNIPNSLLSDMNSYPSEKSVVCFNGVNIVKLSEN